MNNVKLHRGWRADAERRIERLRTDLVDLGSPPLLTSRLDEIIVNFPEWQVDQTWQHLHSLEEEIGGAARGRVLLNYSIRAVEHANDPALEGSNAFDVVEDAWDRVRQVAKRSELPDAHHQESLAVDVASVLHHAHTMTDERHFAANETRLRLIVTIWGLVGLSVAIFLASLALSDLPFLTGGESFAGVSQWQVALLVALGGLVGGSLGALRAFTSTKHDRYRIEYARAGLRLSLGVFSALIGVALVGAGWVTSLTTDSASALFAVAVAFGVSQEPLTRILESRMQGVITEQAGTTTGSG